MNGADDLIVRVRTALLDALTALDEHRDSVIVIGAQAVYLRTDHAAVAVAETTKDSDLAIDSRSLRSDPLIEAAMTSAGFYLDPVSDQPGAWMSSGGIPVDLMVPEAIAGGRSRRAAEVPPHDKRALRRAVGLEAAVVDNSEMEITSLAPDDSRHITARVAGSAALLVAKLHKISERTNTPKRLVDKDAHDVYRLLVAVPTADLAERLQELTNDELAGAVTRQALVHLRELFAAGPTALGSAMAGRTEEGVGQPATVAAACAFLASDLLEALR